jgi:S-(hydroxymethyl)glutathione dehydrogenase/alcohol dehydrogenase
LHTDLEVIDAALRYPMPIVLGHEAAGVIEDVGSAVAKSRISLDQGAVDDLQLAA